MGCEKRPITIYKGFGTRWDNNDLVFISFDSEISLSGFSAEFSIGNIIKTYQNIQHGFSVNLTAEETATLPLGLISGTLVIADEEHNKRPFTTEIPILVKDWEDGDIKLDGYMLTIKSLVEQNKFNIKIETYNTSIINERMVESKIALHNANEEAHPYIRGLISEKISEHNLSEEAHPYIQGLFAEKQDVIDDLSTIRSGAAAGATAIQPNTNISQLVNDVGYTTNKGTVISINGVEPDSSGNVTLELPPTVDPYTMQEIDALWQGVN